VIYFAPKWQLWAWGHARQNSRQISMACSRCSRAENRGSRRSISTATLCGSGTPSPRRIGPTPRFAHHFQPFILLRSSARASSDWETDIRVLATWIVKSTCISPVHAIIQPIITSTCQICKTLVGPIRADSGADALHTNRLPPPHGATAQRAGCVGSPGASHEIQIPRNGLVPKSKTLAGGYGRGVIPSPAYTKGRLGTCENSGARCRK
jgi:hypothetical protein